MTCLRCVTPAMCERSGFGCSPGTWPSENAAMAKTVAERQAEFKKTMRDAGYVRLEAYVTKEQREKFRRLGGDEWLRKKIEQAKEKE